MNNFLTGMIILLLIFPCTQNNAKIDYGAQVDRTATIDDIISDTTKVLVSELPIKFDSTEILIYAVGLVDLEERGGYNKIGSGSYSNSISSGYLSGDDLIGKYVNLIFQDQSGTKRILTRDKMVINRSIFLRQIFKKTRKKFLLYSVYDRDTNGDGEFNQSDLEALYISRIEGTSFRKLTKELHEFYDYQILKGESILYFGTLEDVNRDGKFNNKDKFHYYQTDLTNDKLNIEEFYPLDIFEK